MERLASLDHQPTRLAVTAERGLLAALEGSCKVPIAGHARLVEGQILLKGLVANLSGTVVITGEMTGAPENARELGVALGEDLLSRGARQISWPKSANMELRGKTILITRAASQSEEMRTGLEAAGARVIECPAIEIVPVEDWTEVDRAASNLATYDWLILTSSNAVAVLHATRAGARLDVQHSHRRDRHGTLPGKLATWDLTPSCIPADFRAEGLLEAFRTADLNGMRILIPRAENGTRASSGGIAPPRGRCRRSDGLSNGESHRGADRSSRPLARRENRCGGVHKSIGCSLFCRRAWRRPCLRFWGLSRLR